MLGRPYTVDDLLHLIAADYVNGVGALTPAGSPYSSSGTVEEDLVSAVSRTDLGSNDGLSSRPSILLHRPSESGLGSKRPTADASPISSARPGAASTMQRSHVWIGVCLCVRDYLVSDEDERDGGRVR